MTFALKFNKNEQAVLTRNFGGELAALARRTAFEARMSYLDGRVAQSKKLNRKAEMLGRKALAAGYGV